MTTEQDIHDFTTKGGINIRRTTEPETYEGARTLVDSLDCTAAFCSLPTSSIRVVTRWDMGYRPAGGSFGNLSRGVCAGVE